MVVAFFGRGETLGGLADEALLWQTIVGGFALLLGAVSITQVNWQKIRTRHPDTFYSAVLLVCFVVMSFAGVFFGMGQNGLFDWLFENIQMPMMSTMFSMLAFFIASAAYRAFRARSIPSTILLVTALLVMLGRIPYGQMMYDSLPAWANWIMMIPNVAVQRGIMIGSALGAAAMGLRILVGIERTYLGR